MAVSPVPSAIPLLCPSCQRYLCTADGTYVRCAPCVCGVRTTVELVGRRARATVETPCGPIEVK